ncbi:MAG: SRPBCC family protein [Gemmatimonadales bacterium]|nr:SRPBCC family protein [Gemmatimonadales bacterium]
MLKAILIVVVVLVAVCAVVALIGSRLPVAHVASRSIDLPTSPDSVFRTISDFAAAPSWRTGLKSVEILSAPGEPVRFVEVTSQGRMEMAVEKLIPGEKMVTRITDKSLPYGGAWAFAIVPSGTGSTITITEHGEVYNVLFRFMAKYIFGHEKTMDDYLKALAKKYGVTAEPRDGAVVAL